MTPNTPYYSEDFYVGDPPIETCTHSTDKRTKKEVATNLDLMSFTLFAPVFILTAIGEHLLIRK